MNCVVRFSADIKNDYYLTKKLVQIGILNNYKGFYYLVGILDVIINKGKVIRSFSADVYPFIAKKFNSSECGIERDIRHIIDIFWTEKRDLIKEHNFTTKPKCRQFIYQIKNYIMQDFT